MHAELAYVTRINERINSPKVKTYSGMNCICTATALVHNRQTNMVERHIMDCAPYLANDAIIGPV
jgi:hypothetical protein